MSEMPLRMTKQEQHVMCFVPEEPNIIVTTESGNNDLDFQTTHDSSSKTLFVKLENKNNIEVSLKISLINVKYCFSMFTLMMYGMYIPNQKFENFSTWRYNLNLKKKSPISKISRISLNINAEELSTNR